MRNQLKCGSEDRRQAIKNSAHLNGIDYLEVLPPANINEKPLLIVRLFKPVAGLTKDNLVIDGGVRIRNISIEWANLANEVITTPQPQPRQHFSPVYAQDASGSGIGGYDLRSTADRAFAFDYDHSGKLDHMALYRPGSGAISILKNTNGSFSPVYAQGGGGVGIGGYDLASTADRAFAFDYDSSGKMDHIVLYRPGTGIISILKNTNGSFSPALVVPVWTWFHHSGGAGSGIGGYDLAGPTDRAFAFDYDHSGKLDHMALYRPGDGAMFIVRNNAGNFKWVYAQGGGGVGIGGYALASTADRAFAFDYDSSGKMDHIVLYRPGSSSPVGYDRQHIDHNVLYRPGTGTMWILKNTNGSFSPVYAQGGGGVGIGGYDLASTADRAFAFDYDSSGKMDHIVLYRPGTGIISILRNNAGNFSPVYAQSATGNGIGGYDLRSTADRAFAFDYDSSGKMDHIVLYRPGTGIISILRNNAGNLMVIRPNSDGDFSTYTLGIVRGLNDRKLPPEGFDNILSRIDFSFKVACSSDFDCKNQRLCPQELLSEPAIDYMAKDFASFRKVVRDRLTAIMPKWKQENPSDLGIVLVESLAYIGDYLSYYQDAVATEAYLGTARSRISVRRHTRLLDYRIHDGCNARAWVCIDVDGGSDGMEIPAGTRLITSSSDEYNNNSTSNPTLNEQDLKKALVEGAKVFETMHKVRLYSDHNTILFYTWGNSKCCLPKGATHATLRDDLRDDATQRGLKIQVGDVLIFEEVQSPSGSRNDRDLSHRHAVRLIEAERRTDALNNTKIIDIAWDPEDALPFPLCIDEVTNQGPQAVSIAYGNIVLADHGYTLDKEPLGDTSRGRKFRPRLTNRPLTFSAPFDPSLPASSVFNYKPWEAKPAIYIEEEEEEEEEEEQPSHGPPARRWEPVLHDLLSSDKFSREFVVEMENDGTAQVRFGDGKHGMNPLDNDNDDILTRLGAVYRIGNGSEGNVGDDTITRIVKSGSFDAAGINRLYNPIPAKGGIDPEISNEARQNAPEAFRVQERAVNESDYVNVLKRHPEVQRAAATIRWTGSWYTVFVTIDRYGGQPIDELFKDSIHTFLDNYRLAGYDIEINEPLYVPLEIEMDVCIDSNHLNTKVTEALIEEFCNRNFVRSGVRIKGFFHPDKFTFGQPVILSRIYERALKVDGVISVVVNKFGRKGRTDSHDNVDEGMIKMASFEIARLDNDPNFPENGLLKFNVRGGR